MKKKIEIPEAELEKGMIDRILSQRWIAIVGILVIASALLASFTSKDYLGRYDLAASTVESELPIDEGIEVIDITSADSISPGQDPIAGIVETDTSVSNPDLAVAAENDPPGGDQTEQATTSVATGSGSSNGFPDLSEIRKQHNAFRGPLSQGISYHKNIPVDWDGASSKNVLWKIEVPKAGNSSPVIWADRLFVSGADAQSRWVYCYNRNDGKLLWEHEAKDIEGSPESTPKTTPDTGLAAPTLTTDGKRIYAIFGTGDILALDYSGKRIWAKNLGVPDNHYGHSSSLICWKEKLIVQYDTNKSGRMMALNVMDGNTIWDISREVNISWASPVLAEIGGKYQILTTSDPLAMGHELETGKEIWAVECMMGEVGPSVGFSEGLVYPSNEYARMVAIKPGATAAEIVWESDEYLPEASSPVVTEGLVFLGTSYGVFACSDAKTGELLWEFEGNSGFYGSPMAADGKIYVMDMSGICYIFEISRELKLLGEPKLGEKSVVTPAFADGKIYLRGSKYLYCIGA